MKSYSLFSPTNARKNALFSLSMSSLILQNKLQNYYPYYKIYRHRMDARKYVFDSLRLLYQLHGRRSIERKSPLFGRRTAQLQVKPFSYREAADFVSSYTPAEKAVCYGITGGVAKYLSLLRDTKSLDENIVSLFFAKPVICMKSHPIC